MNYPLLSMLWSMTATVVIGIFMIVALVTGFSEIAHIWIAVIAGAVLAIPIAFLLTKKISHIKG